MKATEGTGRAPRLAAFARLAIPSATAGILASLVARPIWAHPGVPPAPHDLPTAWNLDPWVLLSIGIPTWLYARGLGRLWRAAGRGRGVPVARFWCFAAGMLLLFVALVTPLDALGLALFSGHMAQHEILILGAAPLLVLGTPTLPTLWGLHPAARRIVGRWARHATTRSLWRPLSSPLSAWLLHAAAVWIWHAPALYQATLRNEIVHVAQHASFFGTALLFWWALLGPGRRRLSPGLAVIYLFTTAIHGGALGALLTFAPSPWYPVYAPSAPLWGLTPLEDQQLGGLIMWIPFGTLYTLAALALLGVWLRDADSRFPSGYGIPVRPSGLPAHGQPGIPRGG